MISFNNLGNFGRLGNQMFQYAALRGIAEFNGYDWCVPPGDQFGSSDCKVRQTGRNLYDCFELKSIQNFATTHFPVVSHLESTYNPRMFEISDGTDILGYFQSEKYFHQIKDSIKQDFKFKAEHSKKAEDFMRRLGSSNMVSLHVRRTDYLNYPHIHTNMFQSGYYHRAVDLFKDFGFLVFSDDIAWCKEQDLFKTNNMYFSEGNDSFVDLCLMTMCSYNIIANSSYSWWGGYLNQNPNKKIVAPRGWFGTGVGQFDDQNYIYIKEFIVL